MYSAAGGGAILLFVLLGPPSRNWPTSCWPIALGHNLVLLTKLKSADDRLAQAARAGRKLVAADVVRLGIPGPSGACLVSWEGGVNLRSMEALKAVVKNGRLILNEATDLPEGAEVELAVVDDHDGDAELLEELEASAADEAAGNLVDFDAVIARLGSKP
jgi:hypothetical protein